MEPTPDGPRELRRFVQRVLDGGESHFEARKKDGSLLGKFRFVELANKTRPDDNTAIVAFAPTEAKIVLREMQEWIARSGGNVSAGPREGGEREESTRREGAGAALASTSDVGPRTAQVEDALAAAEIRLSPESVPLTTPADFGPFAYDCVERWYARVPVSKISGDLPHDLNRSDLRLTSTLSITHRARDRNNQEGEEELQLTEVSSSRVRQILDQIRGMPNVRMEPDFGDGNFCVNVHGAPCVLSALEEKRRQEKLFDSARAEEEWIKEHCSPALIDLHELDRRIKELQGDDAIAATFPYAITGLPSYQENQKTFVFEPPERREASNTRRVKNANEYTEVTDLDAVLREIMPLRPPRYSEMPSLDVSLGKFTLFEYQKKAVSWMVGREEGQYLSGGILADDMGLGKTVTCAALLRHCETCLTAVADTRDALAWQRELAVKIGMPVDENRKMSRRTLIVAPKAVLPVWEKTLRDAGVVTKDQLYVYHEDRKTRPKETPDFSITLTTYRTFGQAASELSGDDLNGGWQRVLLDEGHEIRNDETKTAKALTESLQARTRWIVSGTPLVNCTSDLRSMFKFLHFAPFNDDRFFQRWIKFTKGDAIEQEHRLGMLRMHRTVQPIMLRRSKAQLQSLLPALDRFPLPKKLEHKELVPLDAHEQRCYDFLLEKPKENGVQYLLQLIARARQMVLHPGLISERYLPEDARSRYANEGQSPISSKMKAVAEIVFDRARSVHRGEPVIVFSFFKSFFQKLKPYLIEEANRRRLSPFRIETYDGETPGRKRDRVVDDFQAGHVAVLLCSLKAGGVGLTLTRGRTAILCDPWWNRPIETQAIDRIHRLGSKYETVNIYRLIAKGTIEERILELQELKNFEKEGVIDNQDEDFLNAIPIHKRNKLFTHMEVDGRGQAPAPADTGEGGEQEDVGWWSAYDANVISGDTIESNSHVVDPIPNVSLAPATRNARDYAESGFFAAVKRFFRLASSHGPRDAN